MDRCLTQPSNSQPGPLQASALLNNWDSAIVGLADEALAAVDSAPDAGLPGGLAAQLQQAAHSLREQRREVLSGLAVGAGMAERASQLRQLLQPATDLAGLMQQWHTLPAVEEEKRVAVARAAATRSCAYLRCANVDGAGGPAAHQGEGSKKCR